MRTIQRVLFLAFLFLIILSGVVSLPVEKTLASSGGVSGVIFLPIVSNPQSTLSTNQTPELTSLTPTIIDPAKAPLNLTLTGKNFTQETRVRWNGAERSVNVLSKTQLSLPIDLTDLGSDTEVAIAVYNPGPNGGVSNQLQLSLLPAGGNPALSLEDFIASVIDGNANVLRGVYAEGVGAAPVVQQPEKAPNYVSSKEGVLTQYNAAMKFGVTGLLAHNYLAGKYFSDLTPGQEVVLVFGDGSTKLYRVNAQAHYQALSPNDPYSDFIDLANNEPLTAAELFSMYYMGEDHVTFQTCIEQEGQPSWGRLFVTAVPVE